MLLGVTLRVANTARKKHLEGLDWRLGLRKQSSGIDWRLILRL